MKKLIFLIPLMFLSSVENVNAMRNGRKSMRKMRMRRGSKRRRGHQSRRDKRVVLCQKVRAKKVDLTGCLSAPQKKFSLNSLVPKLSFSFNKKSLASSVLLLYMIFGQFLGDKQVECYRWGSHCGFDPDCEFRLDAWDKYWGLGRYSYSDRPTDFQIYSAFEAMRESITGSK